MNRYLDKFMFILQWILILLLIPALLSPYINPETITLPAFLSLFFPYLTAFLILVGIYGLFKLELRFLPTLIMLVLSFGGLTKTWAVNWATDKVDPEDPSKEISLMSYNVQGFGRYQQDSIIRDYLTLFKKNQPEVLCLQEFYAKEGIPSSNLDLVSNAGDYPYRYCNTASYRGRGKFFGLVVFSKHPIINQGYLDFKKEHANGCIYVDVQWEKDTLRIFNVHLQSTHLFPANRLDKPNEEKRFFRELIPRIKRLNKGFIKRSWQARKVTEAISESPHPVMLCGDLNDTPLSFAYEKLTSELKDAFLAKGFGVGTTYAETFPWLRIDYILLEENWKLKKFRIIHEKFSDHYPIYCVVSPDSTA